jgi:hypothetical protein
MVFVTPMHRKRGRLGETDIDRRLTRALESAQAALGTHLMPLAMVYMDKEKDGDVAVYVVSNMTDIPDKVDVLLAGVACLQEPDSSKLVPLPRIVQ